LSSSGIQSALAPQSSGDMARSLLLGLKLIVKGELMLLGVRSVAGIFTFCCRRGLGRLL